MATVAHWMLHVECTEGLMRRSMAGLLAAVGAAMSALVGLVRGDLAGIMVAGVAGAAGLAAYLAIPASKNLRDCRSATTCSGSACVGGIEIPAASLPRPT
jgi:hypothetical protein